MRVAFDTTVLWGAFHRPAGPNFALLALAAQRTPVLDGFITDVVGAEFSWRAIDYRVARAASLLPVRTNAHIRQPTRDQRGFLHL
jgi:hypothetical protein